MLSRQQQRIVEAVNEGKHVIVSASPGSGKTTLAMELLATCKDKSSIMLTYNRSLRDSTAERLKTIDSGKVSHKRVVFTFHGLMTALTGTTVSDDITMAALVNDIPMLLSKIDVNWEHRNASLLIIDECQDMRPSYTRLVLILIFYVLKQPDALRILVVGDVRQLLYNFYSIGSADARFLMSADKIFGKINSRPWQRLPLSKSFRISEPMCKVVNRLMALNRPDEVQHPVICGIDDTHRPPVSLYIADAYLDSANIIKKIISHSECPYSSSDVMVLLCSTNSRSPARTIVTDLCNLGIPVHVVRSGEIATGFSSSGGKSITGGKMQFRTLHSSKGLEAKLIIFVNVRPLFELIENSQFVALTRGSVELVVITHYRHVQMSDLDLLREGMTNSDLRIIQHRQLPKNVIINKTVGTPPPKQQDSKMSISCNGIFAFIDVNSMISLMKNIKIDMIQPPLDFNEDEWTSEVDDLSVVVDTVDQVDALDNNIGSDYATTMMRTFDGGITYVDVTDMCGEVLKMGLEYFHTKRIPKRVSVLIANMMRKNPNTKIENLIRRHVTAADLIFNMKRRVSDDDETDTLRRFEGFAMMALISDAITYPDRIMQIRNFGWSVTAGIFLRFRALCNSLSSVLRDNHSLVDGEFRDNLEWFVTKTTKLDLIGPPQVKLTVNAEISITTPNTDFCVTLIHSPNIGNCDLLSTVLASGVAGGTDHCQSFVINCFDASICHVSCAEGVSQNTFMDLAIISKFKTGSEVDDVNFFREFGEYIAEIKSAQAAISMEDDEDDDEGDSDEEDCDMDSDDDDDESVTDC